MSAPGYLCYYARHVKVYQHDPRIPWDLTPWWDALSPSVKKLYQDEEEGRLYIDPNDHLITAVGLYYYHHRRTARMANSARAWDTLRKQWENESADVRGYWEGLLFYRRASIASPAVSSNSFGAAAAPAQIIPTAVTSYYPRCSQPQTFQRAQVSRWVSELSNWLWMTTRVRLTESRPKICQTNTAERRCGTSSCTASRRGS